VNSKHSIIATLAVASAFAEPAFAQLQGARTFILIGPPGSGKTLQADYLRKQYRVPVVSMSHLLQQEVDRKSSRGKALAASLASGELLADGPANDLMLARLLLPDVGRGFILDGYPATEGQAKALDQWLSEHNLPKPTVVILETPEDVSRNRMERRGRADDEASNIDRRLRDYREVGKLVEQWYGSEGVVRVDGTGAAADVARRIASAIDALQTTRGLKRRNAEEEGLKRRQTEPPASEQKH
jgi:adenylate kinase